MPPEFFLRFFRWFCRPKMRDHIEGDLIEVYKERVGKIGKRSASLHFVIDVILLCRPGIIRPMGDYQKQNNYAMFKNYFTVGWRNLLRNKGYSTINIGGLAAGVSISLLIGLWINDELSHNKYHQNYERIVQVMQQLPFDGKIHTWHALPRPMENAVRTAHGSDFEYVVMSSWINEHIVSQGDQKVVAQGSYVQAGLPEMLTLKMISGSRSALKDQTAILLSSSVAKALFGTKDPLDQSMRIDNALDVKVGGVYEDLPDNTSFREMKFMASWELWVASEPWIQRAETQWDNNSFQMFAQVVPGVQIDDLNARIKLLRQKSSAVGEWKPEVFANPMPRWHLYSEWDNGINTGGRIRLVIMFATIGVFVLLLACINFMNLTTARSEKRAKEVGIRMTIGSMRTQLINQFLSESFLVVFMAFVIAIGIVTLLLPFFNELASKSIAMPWDNQYMWLIIGTFILITSLVAGSYPAIFLSSFRPVSVLKGGWKSGSGASLPRRILVVLQFTVSITLVIGTIIVYDQIEFTRNRPMGYDRTGLLMLEMKTPEFRGKMEVLSNALKQTGYVEEVAQSSSPLTGVWNYSGGYNWKGKDPATQSSDFGVIRVSPEYGKTVKWQIVEGRDFLPGAADSTAVILNQAALKFMNVTDALGMEILYQGSKLHVIGVVADMVMNSPYTPVGHNVYRLDQSYHNIFIVRLRPGVDLQQALNAMESIFKTHVPSAPFDFRFIEDEFSKKFQEERQLGKLTYVFALLATFISCLGLIGLASFVAERRTKEIGIRKILGASVTSLWKKLSSEFFVLVVIASAISMPVGYALMSKWLSNYPYRVEIGWEVFVLAAIAAVVVTFLTVSFQAIKAAAANPVKSLRSE